MSMRNTEKYLRRMIREVLQDDQEDDSYFSGLPVRPDWIPDIPKDVMITVSSKPIAAIRDTSRQCGYDRKPRGLWYAPGSEWLDWIQYNMPVWYDNVGYIYKLQPAYTQGGISAPFDYIGGVLQLQTPEEMLEFSRRFVVSDGHEINWTAVSDMWDGIEIIPDQQHMVNNPSTRWYWGWDIPSGCIWRPEGVAEFKLFASRNK